MSEANATVDADARARKRGRTIVGYVMLALAAAFILTSLEQLVVGAFYTTPAALPPGACADGIADLSRALDRALAAATQARGANTDGSDDAFAASENPAWSARASVEASCKGVPRGTDAFAAIERLRRGYQESLLRSHADLQPLRHDVDGYLGR